jgi:hypothetical protein
MWRQIEGSIRGASHEKSGAPCQDCHVTRTVHCGYASALVACIADGAGSSPQSHRGARITCDAIVQRAGRHFEGRGSFASLGREDVIAWCAVVQAELRQRAAAEHHDLRDYACTLCVALLSSDCSVFFQIGDGAIVVGRGPACGVVFWPQSGEYANSTNFLTHPQFAEHLDFHSEPGGFDRAALFTDGLERLALSFEGRTPHVPFFAPFFHAVETVDDLDKLNRDLRGFLMSELVQNRSDDDKTVIFAIQPADV